METTPASVPVTTFGENPTDAEHDNQVTTITTQLKDEESNNDDEDEDEDDDDDEDEDEAKDAYYEARNGNESDELETAFQSSLTLAASDVRVNICDADADDGDDDNEARAEDARAEQQPELEANRMSNYSKSCN